MFAAVSPLVVAGPANATLRRTTRVALNTHVLAEAEYIESDIDSNKEQTDVPVTPSTRGRGLRSTKARPAEVLALVSLSALCLRYSRAIVAEVRSGAEVPLGDFGCVVPLSGTRRYTYCVGLGKQCEEVGTNRRAIRLLRDC